MADTTPTANMREILNKQAVTQSIDTTEQYRKTYTSFAGTDIVATINLPTEFGGGTYVLGELQTVSYSVHREVSAVPALGRISPLGFTAGPRTIAGSLIFTAFNKNLAVTLKKMLIDLTAANKADQSVGWKRTGLLDKNRASSIAKNAVLMDELPPFDIIIMMKNEYGQASYLAIRGIVIIDEGQVMSIEDLIVENTFSYMARDLEPLTPFGS